MKTIAESMNISNETEDGKVWNVLLSPHFRSLTLFILKCRLVCHHHNIILLPWRHGPMIFDRIIATFLLRKELVVCVTSPKVFNQSFLKLCRVFSLYDNVAVVSCFIDYLQGYCYL